MQTQQLGAGFGAACAGPPVTTGGGRRRGRPRPGAARGGPAMTRLRTALDGVRAVRAHRRSQRDLQRALAAAPTRESRHEIASLAARD